MAEPEFARDSGPEIPLSIHIETINRGVERLDHARRRLKEIEDDRVREVLARGEEEMGMIDSQ